MDVKKIGAFIAGARKEKSMTQRELGARLGVSDRAVSKWERGLNLPDAALFEPLARELGVTIPEMLRGEREAATAADPAQAVRDTLSLAEYRERMPEDQPYYYYACGESAEKIAKLPQVERILDKGYEILYCTEDVDDFVMRGLGEIDGKAFKSVNDEDALPQSDEEKKTAEEKAEAGKPVLEAVKEALGEEVKEVRASSILKSGAVCLTADGPVSLEMEKYMRKVDGDRAARAQRVLELNPDSAPFAALQKAVEAGDKDTVSKYAKLLYGQALLLADLPLEDPAEYAQLVCSLMV